MDLYKDLPDGFLLSESALYSYLCQDHYPDIISFAAAIPENLRSLFLIPIKLETITTASEIASRVASCCRHADGAIPTGDTEEGNLFGTKTFINDDNEPTIPSSEPGSIFNIDGADSITHHQEYNYDENIQVPTETTFMEDVDMTQYWDYPYRTDQTQVRHSSICAVPVVIARFAVKPEQVIPHTPDKIKKNAKFCAVSLVSYNKKSRVYTFSVDAGNGAKTVQAALSDRDHVTLSCNCPFWRYNGPEFNAVNNGFMLGQPFGTAESPDIRDPERKYWLCKHAYAVLRRLDGFVEEIVDENWEMDDEEILDEVDKEWDRLEGVAKVPIDDFEKEDIDVTFEDETDEEPEGTPAEEGPPLDELDEDYDVDVSELDEGPEDYDTLIEDVEEEPIEEYDIDLDELEEEPETDYSEEESNEESEKVHNYDMDEDQQQK
jgi:hypothetical protein